VVAISFLLSLIAHPNGRIHSFVSDAHGSMR
jgi:hypothetical protein